MGGTRVVELFAGVGGFHLAAKKSDWDVIWANEWFPDTVVQHAYDCYEKHFPGICVNENIAKVVDKVPDHDLLVGGFPCQDYSVAASQRKGIKGKKGVLWWELSKIIARKNPKYILLENVDRLLKSPVGQRGRDFAIMLATLDNLGYTVEWRILNAADYGFPQKRRRVFIFAWNSNNKWNTKFTNLEKRLSNSSAGVHSSDLGRKWLEKEGLFSSVFPTNLSESENIFSFVDQITLDDFGSNSKDRPRVGTDPVDNQRLLRISDNWPKYNPASHPFKSAGLMSKGKVISCSYKSAYKGPRKLLKHVIERGGVGDSYYLDEESIGSVEEPKKGTWRYEKGAKEIPRKDKDTGFEYTRTEGAIPFPDSLNSPSRTVITGEGGAYPARHKHVIESSGRFRRLTPVEVEKLNGFRKNWTNTGMPESKRYYCMGNSLVVGLVAEIMKGIKNP